MHPQDARQSKPRNEYMTLFDSIILGIIEGVTEFADFLNRPSGPREQTRWPSSDRV